MAADFGQTSKKGFRFRFDRESVRLLALAPFERWMNSLPPGSQFGIEVEPSAPEFHLLECPNLRRFAPALMDRVGMPFARLSNDALTLLVLVALPDLAVLRTPTDVSVNFAIDALQTVLMDQYRRIQHLPSATDQLQRMIGVASQLGLTPDDWLDPNPA